MSGTHLSPDLIKELVIGITREIYEKTHTVDGKLVRGQPLSTPTKVQWLMLKFGRLISLIQEIVPDRVWTQIQTHTWPKAQAQVNEQIREQYRTQAQTQAQTQVQTQVQTQDRTQVRSEFEALQKRVEALERQRGLVELREKVADLERKLRESDEAGPGPAVVPPPPVGFNPAEDSDIVVIHEDDGLDAEPKPIPKRPRGPEKSPEGQGKKPRKT